MLYYYYLVMYICYITIVFTKNQNWVSQHLMLKTRSPTLTLVAWDVTLDTFYPMIGVGALSESFYETEFDMLRYE